MRQRVSPSAPCQTPRSLLHKSCIYPATQFTVFKPLILSGIFARRGSSHLGRCFLQMCKDVGSGLLVHLMKMICPAPRCKSPKPGIRSPLSYAHRWACPLRRKWLTIKSVVVKHGRVTGQRSLSSAPRRAPAHALIWFLSGLSSQWTRYSVKPQGWYWIQIHYRLQLN